MTAHNPRGRAGRWKLRSIRRGGSRSYRISYEDHDKLVAAVQRFRHRNPGCDLMVRRMPGGYSRVDRA